jgi:hypothetical protein
VSPRGGQDDVEVRKFMTLPGLEPRPLDRYTDCATGNTSKRGSNQENNAENCRYVSCSEPGISSPLQKSLKAYYSNRGVIIGASGTNLVSSHFHECLKRYFCYV